MHGVDTNRKWRAIITNKSGAQVLTRVHGFIHIKDKYGKSLEKYKIPLGGICLEDSESCMTYISKPIPLFDEPVIITTTISFPDIDDVFDESVYYYRHQ